jgi:hypothetical protein
MAWPDFTYDVWEDFEDTTLEAGLVETDTTSILTLDEGTNYVNGTHAMRVTPVGSDASYVEYTMTAGNVSWGFWYRTENYVANGKELIFCRAFETAGDTLFLLYDQRDWSAVRNISFAEFSAGITVANATWYWIAISWIAGTGAIVKVYQTDKTLVGTITYEGAHEADSLTRLRVGACYAYNAGDIWIDSLVIDKTDATYPLLGWEAAGGGHPAMKRFGGVPHAAVNRGVW